MEMNLQIKVRALQQENVRIKAEFERACVLVAKMHQAAVGEIRGPKLGVLEDVEALRKSHDALEASVQFWKQDSAAAWDQCEERRQENEQLQQQITKLKGELSGF